LTLREGHTRGTTRDSTEEKDNMEQENVKMLELRELTDKLDFASMAYYQKKDPVMSDTQFDLELKRLQSLEKELGVVLPNSPTQRVGSDLQKEFKKITHPSPMLTIENTYNSDELNAWLDKMSEEHDGPIMYNISVKYDGISCELCYKGGYLQTGSTRGDKVVGDDITANVKTIKDIPLKLKSNVHSEKELYVRGEILMPKSSLKRVNSVLLSEGKKPFANCRNACAGSVKQLDPSITASRGLIFRPWDIFSDEIGILSQTEKTSLLMALGFTYEEGTQPWSCKHDVSNMVDIFYEKLKSMDLDFDWDGIVIKADSVALQEEIGTKDNRSIEWGIARKWNEDKEVITRLEGVEFQVGRTGVVTPVGKLVPVPCDGVIISNVILNNESYIKKLGIQINKPIRIVRSGSVIPKAIGIATENEYHEFHSPGTPINLLARVYRDVEFPKVCPVCGEPISKVGEMYMCINPFCPAQVEGKIQQWCSRECMNIEGIGPSVVHDLCEKLKISSPLDLYSLVETMSIQEIVYALGEGYGYKSVKTMVDNIIASKSKPFETVLFGMGIPGIGKENAKALAKHFKNFEAVLNAAPSEYAAIEGIGSVLAASIEEFMEGYGATWLYNLIEFGLSTEYSSGVSYAQNEQILEGMNIVFTGKSAHWEGDLVEAVFSSYGAKCGHGVSKKTTYLITGDKPGGSKLAKAKDLGIEVISEADFIAKYNIPVDQQAKEETKDAAPNEPEASDTDPLF